VQPLALNETADVAGKRNQFADDAEISRGRPWLTRSGSIVEKAGSRSVIEPTNLARAPIRQLSG